MLTFDSDYLYEQKLLERFMSFQSSCGSGGVLLEWCEYQKVHCNNYWKLMEYGDYKDLENIHC